MKSLKFDTIYTTTKLGKVQKRDVIVEENEDGTATMTSLTGLLEGKISVSKKNFIKGSNIGKSNEGSPFDVACVKANRDNINHIEDNWHLDIEDADKKPFTKPMLACGFTEKKVLEALTRDGYVYVQPKMNGARCTSYRHLGEQEMWSRQRKNFPGINHIRDAVKDFFGDEFSPDGEAYIHGMSLQNIMKLVKKYRPGKSEKVEMWIYDLAIPYMTFEERLQVRDYLFSMNDQKSHPFVKVDTAECRTIEEIKAKQQEYLENGFEGLIIRFAHEKYGFNDRPTGLMKFKKFFDKEFKIIETGTEVWHDSLNDVYRELILFVVEIPDNPIKLRVRPRGSFIQREKDHKVADQFIGKWLNVRYQEYSDDGVPTMPVGIGVREGEEVDGEFIPSY